MSKGLFISFEGIDGSGKTTQSNLLVDWFKKNSYKVLKTFEPGGSQIGGEVRNLLLNDCHTVSPLTETLLLFADRYEHQQTVIIPALNAGQIVISDRAHDSTVAYQAYGKGVSKELILEFQDSYLIQPHLTFLMKLKPDQLSKRVKKRVKNTGMKTNKFDHYGTDFFTRVSDGYDYIERTFKDRVRSIDAHSASDVIFRNIQSQVYAFLRNHRI